MHTVENTRTLFIQRYRREHRLAVPALFFGAILMVALPILAGTSVLGYLGAGLLAPTMIFGLMRSIKIARASDKEVLEAAGKTHLGLFAFIGFGMCLFGWGTGGLSHALYLLAAVLLIMPSEFKRVERAHALLANS